MRLLLAIALCALAAAQTRVDLGTQGSNVDFSAAAKTLPAKTGTSLPATCGVGEFFFNKSSTAGQNLYLCTLTNTWTQITAGVPGPPGPSGAPLPFSTTVTAGLVSILNASGGAIGCNGVNVAIAQGTSTIAPLSGTATETLRVGFSCADSRLKLLAPSNGLTCTPAGFIGCDVVAASAFTDGIVPLFSVIMVSDGVSSFTFSAPTDLRAALQDDPLTAGTGIVYTKSGSARTVSVDSSAVPLLGTSSDFLEISPPVAPASGRERVYAKASAGLCAKDSGGTERCTGGSSALGTLQYVSVPLTSAQIKALVGTPITLVAAPGSNLAIEVVSVTLVYQFGTMAYTGGATTYIGYGNGNSTIGNFSEGFATTIFTAMASQVAFHSAATDETEALTNVANQPLVTINSVTDFAAGDGIAWFHVVYRVVPTNG